MAAETCVVVSYYDGRPSGELIKLLRQIRTIDAGRPFELLVVVNSLEMRRLELPDDLADVGVVLRRNAGFNLGAWDHGWRSRPGYRYYLFLQDDCEIARSGWVARYERELASERVGLVGESLIRWSSWEHFAGLWPEAMGECRALGRRHGIELGKSPTHLQTLALGASQRCLEAMGGFLQADGKVGAIATEVMLSRQCLQRGFVFRQSAWRPFEYIRHPQWMDERENSRTLKWNISQLAKRLTRS